MNNIPAILASAIIAVFSLASCAGSRYAGNGASIPAPEGMSRELKAAGQNVSALNNGKANSITLAVAKTYTPWQKVSLKGKARVDGIPVALGVKIYMEHANRVLVSLNAPLLGEVGRLEIDKDSLLIVNKRGKCYSKVDIASNLAMFGASITDVQDLFLGRVFILGAGTLSSSNASLIDVSAGASDTWILTPRIQDERAQYGFTLFEDGAMLLAAAFTPDEKYLATAEYEHKSNGTDMELTLKLNRKAMKLDLSFEKPDFSPVPLTPISINDKWERVSLKALLRSFS